MQLIFDSLEELRAFVAELDGEENSSATTTAGTTRRRRGRPTAAETAAAAAQPAGNSGFAPPPSAANPPATGFGAPATQPPAVTGFPPPPPQAPAAPQVNPLVGQIILQTERALQAGQPMEAIVGWYRTALGPETAQANWDQIKAAFLPRAAETLLKQIAATLGIQ